MRVCYIPFFFLNDEKCMFRERENLRNKKYKKSVHNRIFMILLWPFDKKKKTRKITCKLIASKISFYCSPTRHFTNLSNGSRNLFRNETEKGRWKWQRNWTRLKWPTNEHKFTDKLQNRVRSKFMSHFHLDRSLK